jgi:hypothetical protein
MINNNWKDIKLLNDSYKNLINNYFKNKTGRYKIDDNILYINYDSWGIEKFFIKNHYNKNKDENYNNFNKIYNIAIVIQIGNWDIFTKMEPYLNNFSNINVNMYFSIINDIATNENIDYIKNKYKNIVIICCENRGMDIGLFLKTLYYMKTKNYNHDYLIKIHTKTNDGFRNESLHNLIGSNEIIINNIKKISKENIGTISGNVIYKYHQNKGVFNSNLYHLENLVKYLYNEDINYNNLEFSAGTMFIIKYNIFNIFNIQNIEYIYNSLNNSDTLDYYWYSIFYKLNINDKKHILNDYNNNKTTKHPNNISYNLRTNKSGLRDSMIEHSVERLFGYICRQQKMELIMP